MQEPPECVLTASWPAVVSAEDGSEPRELPPGAPLPCCAAALGPPPAGGDEGGIPEWCDELPGVLLTRPPGGGSKCEAAVALPSGVGVTAVSVISSARLCELHDGAGETKSYWATCRAAAPLPDSGGGVYCCTELSPAPRHTPALTIRFSGLYSSGGVPRGGAGTLQLHGVRLHLSPARPTPSPAVGGGCSGGSAHALLGPLLSSIAAGQPRPAAAAAPFQCGAASGPPCAAPTAATAPAALAAPAAATNGGSSQRHPAGGPAAHPAAAGPPPAELAALLGAVQDMVEAGMRGLRADLLGSIGALGARLSVVESRVAALEAAAGAPRLPPAGGRASHNGHRGEVTGHTEDGSGAVARLSSTGEEAAVDPRNLQSGGPEAPPALAASGGRT
eukprot:TRINITY_DN25510_c0_g1_i2.p1 TRINITY_DN25510_c0_g1~~TRINITY_DN25510_c0_g1_i2.p1  ORF type:complete len:390 (+),score=75.94 TRINITY_DN25510_c0_g1_i2:103-1272(+)